MLAKQRFVLDTTAFTDTKLRDDYGEGDLLKTVDVLLDLIAKSRIKLNISCHMPPITYKEFYEYMGRYNCPDETMVKAETWIVKKTPIGTILRYLPKYFMNMCKTCVNA